MTTPTDARTTEGSATVDGIRVRYLDSGEPDPGGEGDRPPLVLVHGTGGSIEREYGYLFPMLAARQRVVALDFAQPVPADGRLTLDQLERQVAAVCESVLPGRRVTLVGYSLGAVVATALAAHRPGLAVNLVAVAGWAATDTQQRLRGGVWRRLREDRSPALASYTAFCALGGPFLAAATLEQLAPLLEGQVPGDFDDLQMELNQSIDITALLPEVRATTLVIGCTHDQMVPVRHSKALFAAIPDARYTEVASGHAVLFERPAQLVQLIDRFNARPSAQPAGRVIPEARV
ncbi:alpha/beta fold hydrolase [Streptomyces lichenis]|uniref:Alpha/beta fold hydrolase n=1 Tax=Streptomyces lichenis TaxID=2306967 RepID=A0ABT0IJC2_9ACTN|nr:alpha/beta fold hydrolase [Streptomyces lichenis]MCK8681434.1 alpha/beta fold hydrolase [Streptomyces lichenis]